MKLLLNILLVVMLAAACNKDQDLSDIDLGYQYFPNKLGSFIVYDVDSTVYGITQESFTYQVKEELSEEFVDGEGQPAVQVRRYYRSAGNQPWMLSDVWTQKRTTTTAEKTEENVSFIKLEFPVKEGGAWNGNGHNNFPEWQYRYKNVGDYADVGALEFDKTVTVEQRNVINLVDEEVFYEVYAENIGLVFRQKKDVTYQNAQVEGYNVSYRAIAYSTE